jgi:hypothetical protein
MTDHTRRRPWLAALLALVVSGLGHAYLRRWARAFGWYVAVTAVVFVFVPESAISSVLAGGPPPLRDVAPAAAVVGASVIDAYVLALRNNREHGRERDASPAADSAAAPLGEGVGGSTASSSVSTGRSGTVRCPGCGKETDPTFDFCQWCAEPVEEGTTA